MPVELRFDEYEPGITGWRRGRCIAGRSTVAARDGECNFFCFMTSRQ